MNPLVSIIIPCHNAAAWLGSTLESVLAQTYANCEVIVVDDGSQDASRTVAAGFSTRGVKLVTQPGRGASAARNHGLGLARGEFVRFLDADDLIAPEATTRQVAALAGRPRHIAFGPWARFQTDPATANFVPHPGWHDATALDWLKLTWANTEPMYQCGLFLIPRPLLGRSGGWDERLSLIDDFEFFTRLVAHADGLVFVPAARLYYRSRVPGSLSARKTRQAWESACLSTTLAVDHLLGCEDSPQTRRLSANMVQKLIYSFYPEHVDLRRDLAAHVSRLGGSDISPGGGSGFQWLTRLAGWRLAARVRYLLGRRPA